MPRIQAEDPRSSIADAALRLVATRGIVALTMALLAREVEVTPGALYKHFASRDEILVAMARRARSLMAQDLPTGIQDPMERLEAFYQARLGTAQRHLGVVRMVSSEQLALGLPPEAAAQLQAVVTETRAFLLDTLRQGQRLGQVRSDQPAEGLLMIIMGTVFLLALSSSSWEEKPAPQQTMLAWETLRQLLAPV